MVFKKYEFGFLRKKNFDFDMLKAAKEKENKIYMNENFVFVFINIKKKKIFEILTFYDFEKIVRSSCICDMCTVME